MFSVTYAQLNLWLTAFLWPFTRILALIATAPVLGNNAAPTRVKIGLAAFTTLIVAPTLGPLPQASVFSGAGVWIIAMQLLVGAALGVTMQIVFAAVQAAGEFIGMGMGLGFASFFDPQEHGSSGVLSSLLNILAMLTFLAVDGHLQMIGALVLTFQTLPISADVLNAGIWHSVTSWGGTIISSGVLLSSPVITALLIANLALGVLNRAAPQIGIFQVGFPITMIVGLLLVQAMMPNMIPSFMHLFDLGIEQIGHAVG